MELEWQCEMSSASLIAASSSQAAESLLVHRRILVTPIRIVVVIDSSLEHPKNGPGSERYKRVPRFVLV